MIDLRRLLVLLVMGLMLMASAPTTSAEDDGTSDGSSESSGSSDDGSDETSSDDSSGESEDESSNESESEDASGSSSDDGVEDASEGEANETDEPEVDESEDESSNETEDDGSSNESEEDGSNESEEDGSSETEDDGSNETEDDGSNETEDDGSDETEDDGSDETEELDDANETDDVVDENESGSDDAAEDDLSDEAEAEAEDEDEDEREGEDDFRVDPAPAAPAAAPALVYDGTTEAIRVESPELESPMEARFDALIEFMDANANGAYDLGERVLQRLALGDLPANASQDASGRTLRYQLPQNGSLELRFRTLPDGSTKYDVVVSAFPFSRSDSRLAFGSSASAMGGVRAGLVAGEPAVLAVRGDNVAFMSWVTTVDVDGVLAPVGWSVHTSTSSTSESAIVYWSYPQGALITHDPTLGIIEAIKETLGDARAFYGGLLAMFLLLALGYAVRRRGAP